MAKQSRVINGIERILKVVAALGFILGILASYSLNAPQASYSFQDSFGFFTVVPAKSFDVAGFLVGSIVTGAIVWIVYLVAIYILYGFKKVDDESHESRS
jgi:hypothetical protein